MNAILRTSGHLRQTSLLVTLGFVAALLTGLGFADVAVASPGAGGFGRVYVHKGSVTGLRTTASYTLDAPGRTGPFARALGSRGDIDGDGIPDLLTGDPAWNMNSGRAFVFRGTSRGPEAMSWRTLEGTSSGARFGESL